MTLSGPLPSTQNEIAVVIPAWNERANLELLLPALKGQLESLNLRTEIVVIDAGSHDGTREAAERWGARVVVQQKPGYGGALLEGLAATSAPYAVTMDADLSHRPVFIEEFWKRRHEADLLIASRYVPGGRADMSLLRRFLSLALMLAYGYIKTNWQQAVDLYTRQCSIGVNAKDLAMMAATLAAGGKNPVTGFLPPKASVAAIVARSRALTPIEHWRV